MSKWFASDAMYEELIDHAFRDRGVTRTVLLDAQNIRAIYKKIKKHHLPIVTFQYRLLDDSTAWWWMSVGAVASSDGLWFKLE